MTIRKAILNIILALVPLVSFAQPTDNSPYSRFGFGDIEELYFSHLRHMGGLGATFHDDYHINPVNPSSYASLKSASFEVGLYGEISNLEDSQTQFTSWNGNLAYISLGFPLVNPINDLLDRVERDFSLGMSFTLAPYSRVGYDIASTEVLEDINQVTRRYIGQGGTYNLLWGNAIQYKDISAGLNLGYLFGNIKTQRTVEFDSLDFAFNNFFENNYHVSGFVWNAGASYDLHFPKKDPEDDKVLVDRYVTFGLYGNSGTNFKTDSDNLLLNVRNQFVTVVDTINAESSSNVEGTGRLPAKLGVGVMYNHGKKWGFGIDYERQAWSNYVNDANPAELSDAYKFSLGGFYRPNPNSFTNYLSRIHYQFGYFIRKDARSVQSEEINSQGLTFGLGLPFISQRKLSQANIGVTLGNRGVGSAVEERYMRINFGFTFNDSEWFIKRKYN